MAGPEAGGHAVIEVELEQGSAAWHAWRRDGLGGSDAAAVLGRSPWLSAADLFLEKTEGRAAEREETFAMRRGRRLEDQARRLYVERFGLPVRPLCCQHDDAAWLRASLDGYWQGVLLEIKAPNWANHELALNGIVPEHYRPQLAHQCLASGAAVAHYWSFNDGRKRFPDPDDWTALVAYRPAAEELGELLEAEEAFWARVLERRAELAALRRGA